VAASEASLLTCWLLSPPSAALRLRPWNRGGKFVNKQIARGASRYSKKTRRRAPQWLDRDGAPERWNISRQGRQTGSAGTGRVLICGLPMGEYTVTETVQTVERMQERLLPGGCADNAGVYSVVTFLNSVGLYRRLQDRLLEPGAARLGDHCDERTDGRSVASHDERSRYF